MIAREVYNLHICTRKSMVRRIGWIEFEWKQEITRIEASKKFFFQGDNARTIYLFEYATGSEKKLPLEVTICSKMPCDCPVFNSGFLQSKFSMSCKYLNRYIFLGGSSFSSIILFDSQTKEYTTVSQLQHGRLVMDLHVIIIIDLVSDSLSG